MESSDNTNTEPIRDGKRIHGDIDHSQYEDRRRLIEEDAWEIYKERVAFGEITDEDALKLYEGWLNKWHQE